MVTTSAPTTVIREATRADIPAIVRMGARFIETEYPAAIRFNGDQLGALTTSLLQGGGVVFVAAVGETLVGMMALTTYVHPMSGERIATEMVWWMEPEARGGRAALRLFDAAEAWARGQGATTFQMIAPSDKVAAFYERLGFARIEVHYQRSL